MSPLRQIGGGQYAPTQVTDAVREGCTACHDQDTETICGCHGRRCRDHDAHPDEQEADECQA